MTLAWETAAGPTRTGGATSQRQRALSESTYIPSTADERNVSLSEDSESTFGK